MLVITSFIIFGGISLVAAQSTGAGVFSYCGGDQCTISLSESYLSWGAAATTFSDPAEYSAFESSLSAARASSTGDDSDSNFEITVNAALPTTVIQTADNGYTTITCCDDQYIHGYFLFEPSSCGAKHTALSLDNTPSGYIGYNAAFVTVVPTSVAVNDSVILGGNQCTTMLPAPGAPPPRTKTFYVGLLGSVNLLPASTLPVPSPINGPLITAAPATTGGAGGEGSNSETPAPVASDSENVASPSGGGNTGAEPSAGGGSEEQPTAGSNTPAPAPPPVGSGNGTVVPTPEASSVGSTINAWTWLSAGVVLMVLQATALL